MILIPFVLIWSFGKTWLGGWNFSVSGMGLPFSSFPPLHPSQISLFVLMLAAHVWGSHWSRKRILFRVDNEAVVHILNSRTSPDPNIMHLLRSLLKVAACLSFTFTAVHVPGKNNGVADALSRFNWQGFRSQAPTAKRFPVSISLHLLAQLSTVI